MAKSNSGGRIGRIGLIEDDVRMWAAQAREVFHAPVRVHRRVVSAEGVSADVFVAVVFDGAHRRAANGAAS